MAEAAIQLHFSTFDGKDLYPSINDKAAALVERLVKNHAFIDGNKRIGYVMLRFFLMKNGYDLCASQTDKYNFTIDISKGSLGFEGIKDWIASNTRKI